MRFFIFGIFTIILVETNAQKWSLGLSHEISFPLENTEDFIRNPSFRGASIYFDRRLDDYWSIGGILGLQSFNQDFGLSSETHGTATITASLQNYLHVVPVLFHGAFHLQITPSMMLVLGGGIGVFYINRTIRYAGLTVETRGWQIGARPDVGLEIKLGRHLHFNFKVSYTGTSGSAVYLSQNYCSLGQAILILF